MFFTIVGDITHVETFAVGAEIREVERLRKLYGRGRWRKRKGIARCAWPTTASTSQRFIGMKQPASVRKSSRSSGSFKTTGRQPGRASNQLVICVRNEGYEASLELRKIYVVQEDSEAEAHRLLRVVDESGEGYLYPRSNFLSVILPPATQRAILAAA